MVWTVQVVANCNNLLYSTSLQGPEEVLSLISVKGLFDDCIVVLAYAT